MRQPSRVSFDERVQIRSIEEKSSEMMATEKSLVYLSRDDITSIHEECRELCKATIEEARALAASTPTKTLKEHLYDIIESDERLRGMEMFMSPTRRKIRRMVHKSVIDLYKYLKTIPSMSPLQVELTLASAYSNLSNSSLIQAMISGQHDRVKSCQDNNFRNRYGLQA